MPQYKLKISRTSPGTEHTERFEEQQVDLAPQASVLDALFAVQRSSSPDLAFRFSCRVGMCGSCAMVVNGREVLACSTLVKPLGQEIRIQPLRNLPVVRDLAVDMGPFFDAYKRTQPAFEPRPGLQGFYPIPQNSPQWRALDHQPQCIDCGACYSSCTVVTLNRRYLGPMALHRALNVIVDPRDNKRAERMNIIESEAGAYRCHTLGNCREACPKGISPTASIARLKRLALSDTLRNFFARLLARG